MPVAPAQLLRRQPRQLIKTCYKPILSDVPIRYEVAERYVFSQSLIYQNLLSCFGAITHGLKRGVALRALTLNSSPHRNEELARGGKIENQSFIDHRTDRDWAWDNGLADELSDNGSERAR